MPKKENIQGMFNNIAPDYDKLNHIMSLDIDRTWRKRALKCIFKPDVTERAMAADGDSENGGLHILDIACGTGDFSIAIAKEMLRRAEMQHSSGKSASQTVEKQAESESEESVDGDKGNGDNNGRQAVISAQDTASTGGYWPGHVTGVDLSEGMLKIMGEKIKSGNLENIVSYEQGDCEKLRFEDGTFDRVTVAFGVRNFENREACLREILRVLRPGGKLVILELSVPSNALLRWLFKLYFVNILPIIGGKVSGDKAAYKYLPASVLNFPGKNEFQHTLRSCGYRKVQHKAFTLGICRMYTGEK